MNGHVFFPETLRHPAGVLRPPEQAEQGGTAAAHHGHKRSFPKKPFPEAAQTGKRLEHGRLKTVFKPTDRSPARGRVLRGMVYSLIPAFCQRHGAAFRPSVPRAVGPRRGDALGRAEQNKACPTHPGFLQPCRAGREALPNARGTAGNIIEEERHVRPDAGRQRRQIGNWQRRGGDGVQPAEERAAFTAGRKPDASAKRR